MKTEIFEIVLLSIRSKTRRQDLSTKPKNIKNLKNFKNLKKMKTYGEKPIVFKFDQDDTEYMIGSEVGNYLRLFRGALYKRFPGLTRRTLENNERRKLVEMGHSQHVTASSIR